MDGVRATALAGVFLLVLQMSAIAGPNDERGAVLRALAVRVGNVLGAAASCPTIVPSRVSAMADKLSGVLRAGEDSAAIFDILTKSQADGARAIALKQTDCAITERQLADLESASSPERPQATGAGRDFLGHGCGYYGSRCDAA